jgi:hypothetical protein
MDFTSLLCPALPYISKTERKISFYYNIAFFDALIGRLYSG